ncbi:MAG: N utilization substance protein B [Candidatus Tectimicrobiota bacterium]|nr:MAG: N utilization substance protein B [Candidatus Tectomicrobia bacterium]
MGQRRRAREAALQILYALDVSRQQTLEALRAPWIEEMVPAAARDFTLALVRGAIEHRAEIDALIREWSEHWTLERIGVVERNILRLAIYELLYMPDIPPKVTINEAVELAKKYGDEEAFAFVNGILDRVSHELVQREAP